MTTSVFPSRPISPTVDISTMNSYGSVTHSPDTDVAPSLSMMRSANNETGYPPPLRLKPHTVPCLKPHQSETIFALCLFLLGLSLLVYVIVSYWFTHSQISPVIIFICGLLCFIPGCYYLIEHYCFCLRFQRNRHRRIPIVDQDDVI